MEIVYKLRSGFSSTARIFSVIFMLLLAASGLQAQNVAKIGNTQYATLDAAIDAVQAGETIEILADSVGITNTKVIPANVTITGQGKTATKMTIISSSGSGITINNPGVTLKKMTIDGSQITSGGYKTLVNVRADNVLIDSVIMTKGGMSTWNSSILVETLPSTATFTVSNSTISGSFRGVLRESCSANIVITNCDIDAVYPFNIDGGNGGTVTVTGGSLRGWTSYSSIDKVSFTDVEFGKGSAGYAFLQPYVNTEINGSSFSSDFGVNPTIAPTIFFNDCELAGVPLTSNNIDNLLDGATQEDPSSHAVVVNGGYSANSDGEITGGIYGGNPATLTDMLASGYAAFPLNTDPQTYQVDPAYFIHFNANGGSGTMEDSYVLREAPNNVFTVPACTFTHADFTFSQWNTKADGTGTNLAVGAEMTLTRDTTLYAQWQGAAKIGNTQYATLDAAIDAVQAGETIEILADSVGITNTKVIPANVTITGQGKTATKMTIISSSGSGITINNPGVTLKKMTIDGSQITSGGYKTLVNVRADNVLIDSVIMTKGGMSTWNSSILVETLPSTATFTVSNSTISGSFRGVLRESCSANIVITNCDIDAVYPFNIDGGNGGTVTVTGGSLRGWTSYSSIDKVSFTDVEFGKGSAGYAFLQPYVNTEINGSSFSSDFGVNPTIAPTIFFNDCELAGVPLTSNNIDNLLDGATQEDPSSHAVVVNGGYSANSDGEITGGIYGGNPATLTDMLASGYAAFPLNTDPQTYQVDPAYFIHFNAAGGTGTHGDSIVRRTSPTFTVPANTEFTYGSYGFLNWNSKPYGAGTDIAVGSTMTLSSDTTLYAEWNIDFVAKIGSTTYPTFQAAIDDATTNMTGDVTIELMKNIKEWVLIVQKSGLNLTIDGHSTTLTGQIIIDGEARHCGTETLEIKDINFAYEADAFATYTNSTTLTNGFVVTPTNKGPADAPYKTSRNYIYSHNITVKDCNFDGAGSTEIYAFKGAWGSNPRNIKLDNCTAKNVFGFAFFAGVSHCDAVGTTGIEITDCEATENIQQALYISGGGSSTHNITGNTFTAEDFALYIDNAVNNPTYNLSGNTMTADTVFKLKLNDNGNGGAVASTTNINIDGGTYIGDVVDYDPETHLNISGGIYSEDVSGEPCAPGYSAFANGTVPETWTVTQAWFLYYDKNEVAASGTMDTVAVRRDADDAGRTVTVAACDFTWLPVHTFDKWNTKADGLGTDVAVGSTMTLTSDTTLYALWKNGYTVFYHNNGGTGTIANQSKIFDETITLSDGTGFSREGYTLYWWNTEADESGTGYALGAEYSANANLDLYAAWRSNLTMVMDSTDVVCYGEDNGTDTVKIIGGEMPFKLVLSGTEDRTVTNVMTRTYVFENLKPGAYTVTLTDTLNKDIITGTFTIAQPDTLVISSLTVPDAPCPLMGTGTYEVAMTTTGGNGSNVITWGGDATNVNATETTVTPDADDRDRTYTVNVTVTDQKGCVATATADFTVAPVIANDGTTHSNTTMTIADLSYSLLYDCDTVLRNFGTPEFVFTNPAINEDILDTIFNNVPTVAPDSVFAVGNYTIVWTARDTCGHTVTAEQVISITLQPCPSAFDYHGIEYPAVRIGCDCWTTKNLASTQYSDGRQIPDVMHYPINSRASIYGNLYTYAAAMDGATVTGTTPVQGACPTGWHIPSEAESEALMASAEVQDLMSQGLWVPDNGTNASGFNLLPGGCYNAELDRYERMYVSAYFWIAVPASYIYHACEFGAACSSTELVPGNLSNGFSIRCVMDKPTE